MKNAFYLLSLFFLLACGETSNSNNSSNTSNSNEPPIEQALSDITLLEKEAIGGTKPLQAFFDFANNNADKEFDIDKDNIANALKTAQNYEYAFITVASHTLVKITSFEDCSPSKAWGACMPKGSGYIKKGKLVKQSDYINNIIGIPDNQKRKLYLFN